MKTASVATRLVFATCLLGGLSASVQARTLTPQDEARIHLGMTPAEVRQILGKPDHMARYAYHHQLAWAYQLPDQVVRPGDKVFEVTYENGVVASASDRYLEENDD